MEKIYCVNLNNSWCIYLCMCNSWDVDQNEDFIFIDTNVTVGKSYSSKGWALSRKDIHEWIPVEKFEHECNLIINNITSKAILRFNPRLFYDSSDLSVYLKELYDKGCSKSKIPMRIKVNKNNLYDNLCDKKDYNIDNFETSLLVGKSYSSMGWQLSKEVVSQFFPYEEYSKDYLICINDIVSKANFNPQFRLFYKSKDLSKYLEDLYQINPRQKVNAKIIFEKESTVVDVPFEQSESVIESFNTQSVCPICGESYNKSNSSEIQVKDACNECSEKIQVLRDYNLLKNSSLSNFIKKDFLKDIFDSNLDNRWNLLIKYEFLTPFGNLFKLKGNGDIEKTYSKYLNDSTNENVAHVNKNRQRLLELIGEETEEEKCIVCGIQLSDYEVDKCESCIDKQLAVEYLHDVVTKVPYGDSFSKQVFIKETGISGLDATLILEKLLKYDLLISSDTFYKLNEVSFLNDFVNKYADLKYELQVNYESDNSSNAIISRKDLASEERIDSLVKWKHYGDFISFKRGRYGFMSVQFKQDGAFLYSKGFETSYNAKIEAINYLNALGKLHIIDDEEIRLEFKK